MAHFYPPKPPGEIVGSELKVWRALEDLPDSWRVFHSVRWQSTRGGRQGDGEADFVLLHAKHGGLVFEVKGGEVSLVNGRWLSTNANGTFEIKDPFDQALLSKYALLHYFRNLAPPLKHVSIGHAVVFPDVDVADRIGLAGPRPIVIDRRDLRSVEATLLRVFSHWGRPGILSARDFERVTAALAPTLRVRRTLAATVEDTQIRLIDLTSQQISVLHSLRLVRKAVVLGGAGTGKTILAREKALLCAQEGANVLYTCFNAPLARHMRAELEATPNIRVATFHALCFEEAGQARLSIPRNPDADWWEQEAATLLLEAAALNATTFDAIVVDEAQDFAPDWLQTLSLTTRDPPMSPFYVFADTHQELFCRGWGTPEDWPRFVLSINCRNTTQIARRVGSVYGDPIPTLEASGPEPKLMICNLRKDGIEVVQQLVSRLMQHDRLAPRQIAVLSDDPDFISRLRETGVESTLFCELGRVGIVADSIARFKGLESDVVILALSDRMFAQNTADPALLYVGLSRAKVVLFVLTSERGRAVLAW